jgi:hypothetical protein
MKQKWWPVKKRRGSAGLIKCNLRLFVELSVLELPRVQNTFPKAAQALDFRLLYPTDGCNGQVTSSSKQWLRNFFSFCLENDVIQNL